MPKILTYKNLIFFLVSFDLTERLHLHVFSKNKNREAAAKIWLNPVEVFEQGALTKQELNIALKIINDNSEKIKEAIANFKRGIKVKTIKL
ncbi:MAG: DUF4160 domain-containing protein [Bacteroidetes bacterium]|nr:DUF4160 domain-containing protein [Bacteroidota bacterium]